MGLIPQPFPTPLSSLQNIRSLPGGTRHSWTLSLALPVPRPPHLTSFCLGTQSSSRSRYLLDKVTVNLLPGMFLKDCVECDGVGRISGPPIPLEIPRSVPGASVGDGCRSHSPPKGAEEAWLHFVKSLLLLTCPEDCSRVHGRDRLAIEGGGGFSILDSDLVIWCGSGVFLFSFFFVNYY